MDSRRSRLGAIHRVVYNSISASNCSASEDDADGMSGVSGGSCEPADDPALGFESRFESGNLRRAVMVGKHEYDLVLQTDVNTNGHTQWFFFRIDNTVAGARYKLNIINMMKRDSLCVPATLFSKPFSCFENPFLSHVLLPVCSVSFPIFHIVL